MIRTKEGGIQEVTDQESILDQFQDRLPYEFRLEKELLKQRSYRLNRAALIVDES